MIRIIPTLRRSVCRALALALFLAITNFAAGQDAQLRLDAQRSSVNFILGDVLHTVRGTFQVKRGTVHAVPARQRIGGD